LDKEHADGEEDSMLPGCTLPDGRVVKDCFVKFGGDGFNTIQNHQTKKLILMAQCGFLVLLPGSRFNSRNNTRLVSKQTMPTGFVTSPVDGTSVEDSKKGHSGEDVDHLRPICEKFNEMIKNTALVDVQGHLLRLNWLLSSNYKFQALVFGLGPAAAASAYFCLFCLTRCSKRDHTIRHIPCERSFQSMRLKGTVWEVLKKKITKEDGKLDGRLVVRVLSLLLDKKMTFEQAKEWAQSMQYDPLVDISNEQAVIEVLHAGINLVQKHFSTAKVLANQLGVDLDKAMKECGSEKDITGWDREKSKEVRKRSEEWLSKGLKNHPKLPAILQVWELMDKLLDICEKLEPTEDDISWFGLHALYFGGLVRTEVGPLHSLSVYDHFLICHAWLQMKKWSSLMKYVRPTLNRLMHFGRQRFVIARAKEEGSVKEQM
jgi:hypothetical protein